VKGPAERPDVAIAREGVGHYEEADDAPADAVTGHDDLRKLSMVAPQA
jgi:hypothetical protein